MCFFHIQLEIVLPDEQVSDMTNFQVMSVLILPGDNGYPVINSSKAVRVQTYSTKARVYCTFTQGKF